MLSPYMIRFCWLKLFYRFADFSVEYYWTRRLKGTLTNEVVCGEVTSPSAAALKVAWRKTYMHATLLIFYFDGFACKFIIYFYAFFVRVPLCSETNEKLPVSFPDEHGVLLIFGRTTIFRVAEAASEIYFEGRGRQNHFYYQW